METITADEIAAELSYGRLLDEGIVPDLFATRPLTAKNPSGFPKTVKLPQKMAVYKASITGAFWSYLPRTSVYNQQEGPYVPVLYNKLDFGTIEDTVFLDQTLSAELDVPGKARIRVVQPVDAAGWRSVYFLFSGKKLVGPEYESCCMRLLIAALLIEESGDYPTALTLVSPLHGAFEAARPSVSDAFAREVRSAVGRILYRRRHSILESSTELLALSQALIGLNVKKRKLVETLKSLRSYDKPLQLFLTPRLGTRDMLVTTSPQEIRDAAGVIQRTGLRLFVHAPYTIRLAAPDDPTHALLRNDLTVAAQLGAKGVVVHTASNTSGATTQEAEAQMLATVRAHLRFATEDCPILLETPAKEGRELVTTLGSFAAFYGRFTRDERRRVKVCVDTCHVFSAGYHPLDYLTRLHERFPGAVALVHFNGSSTPLHGKHDRHSWTWQVSALCEVYKAQSWSGFAEYVASAPVWMRSLLDPDGGHPEPRKKVWRDCIGVHELRRVAEWCRTHDVPALVE